MLYFMYVVYMSYIKYTIHTIYITHILAGVVAWQGKNLLHKHKGLSLNPKNKA